MRRPLRFLLLLAILAGLAAAAARLWQRLSAPVPLGSAAAAPPGAGEAPASVADPAPPADLPAPPADDDLAEVRGIGPVYRARLAEAGITSFATLAAAAPAEVAAATGVPEERAADWIAQAAARGSR